MPSSEPRLPSGEGPSEVPAVAPPAGGAVGAQQVPISSAGGANLANQLESTSGSVPTTSSADIGSDFSAMDSPAGSEMPEFKPSASLLRQSAITAHPLPQMFSLSDMLVEAPAWLFSAMLHMIAIIVLGLLLVGIEKTDDLLLNFDYSDRFSDDLDAQDISFPLDMPEELQVVSTISAEQLPDEPSLSLQTTVLPMASPTDQIHQQTVAIRMGLSGREEGMKQSLLAAYGGTAATQEAVKRGLQWLARNQEKSGAWDIDGRFSDGAKQSNPEAGTGLALLAFQGAGYTPNSDRKDPFTPVVVRGWKHLLQRQDEHGNFFKTGAGNSQLYTHAICTIAICELYGMTHDEKYRKQAQWAVDYCVKIQSPEGGWRYFPGAGSDLSVTGWFVMALQSARMAGLEVPSPTLDRISGYLDTVSRKYGSRYAYQAKDGASRTMTAEGLLCRQYLGWTHGDSRLQKGADYLIEQLPSWKKQNVYYWYYAAQVCHHMEGRHWRAWNRVMREIIPSHQVREGRERGSWDPAGDRWGSSGGRLYVTCLSLYSLEVYYRHLPIYQMKLLEGGL